MEPIHVFGFLMGWFVYELIRMPRTTKENAKERLIVCSVVTIVCSTVGFVMLAKLADPSPPTTKAR